MDETQYLLRCLMEECAEVQQRASKALRFGLREIQPGQDLGNDERLSRELDDLAGILAMLRERGCLRPSNVQDVRRKEAKVLVYMNYAEGLGILKKEGS